jgi:hypothetical protein
MKKVIGLLMLLGLFSQQLFAAELKNMKLILDKQGIKIWSYQVANSPFYGFKAVTTVKSRCDRSADSTARAELNHLRGQS